MAIASIAASKPLFINYTSIGIKPFARFAASQRCLSKVFDVTLTNSGTSVHGGAISPQKQKAFTPPKSIVNSIPAFFSICIISNTSCENSVTFTSNLLRNKGEGMTLTGLQDWLILADLLSS